MTYCNPIPIAASCYLPKNVIIDTLAAIFNAVLDLINMGKNVSLKTGFCNINFFGSNLSYNFNPDLGKIIEDTVESESRVYYIFILFYFITFSLKEVLLLLKILGIILLFPNGQKVV